jgi:hypothetical protein
MPFCPDRTKMFSREKFWCDPGDNTRILQDEGLGLLLAFKTGSYTKEPVDLPAILWPPD